MPDRAQLTTMAFCVPPIFSENVITSCTLEVLTNSGGEHQQDETKFCNYRKKHHFY
jgi:hypothetical protein